MDPISIAIAFALGFAVKQIGLPPLVGYLAAGFALHAYGVRAGGAIEALSEFGITLLLFTIGLKLRLGTLVRPEVWAVATAHMAVTIAIAISFLFLAGLFIASLADLPGSGIAMIAFALSFSSTVFAVKVLEERGEMASMHGRISIGILVMQDIFAVLYLAAAEGKVPSVYATLLLGLPLAKPALNHVLSRCGHGELMSLYGFTVALGGAACFELVGIKGGVGALLLGILLSSGPQASELSKTLLGFKDLLLIGFFLSIGLSGIPDWEAVGMAALMLVLLPAKIALLYLMLVVAKVRARTALLASLALANYSEFGLIVATIAIAAGTLNEQWAMAIAIALALSFTIAAPLNVFAHRIYQHGEPRLRRYERSKRLPGDEGIDPGTATVLVCGMGRVGTSAYDEMVRRYGETVIGIDQDEERVAAQRNNGRRLIRGDVTDPDFWEKVNYERLRLVMLAMPNHSENLFTGSQLKGRGFRGAVVATAQFPDEVAALKAAGITEAYNLRSEAGVGFAELSSELLTAQAR